MENKLRDGEKANIAYHVFFIAITGAAIALCAVEKNYILAAVDVLMLYIWYRSLIHLLTWAQIKNEENNINNSNFGTY